MEGRIISKEIVERFYQHLLNEEKSSNTVEKYIRDAKAFMYYTGGAEITKEVVISYKQKLIEGNYAVRSINSILASINSLFVFLGWYDCKVKSLKLQREIYCAEEKELTKAEYLRLVNTAKEKKNERLALILQTICGTGIRVSELQFITVEAAKRGYAKVNCKGKSRTVIIVSSLQKKLLKYAHPKVASVDENGNVKALKKGNATITVTVTDQYGNVVKDTCTVTVKYTFIQWIFKILLFGWIWY